MSNEIHQKVTASHLMLGWPPLLASRSASDSRPTAHYETGQRPKKQIPCAGCSMRNVPSPATFCAASAVEVAHVSSPPSRNAPLSTRSSPTSVSQPSASRFPHLLAPHPSRSSRSIFPPPNRRHLLADRRRVSSVLFVSRLLTQSRGYPWPQHLFHSKKTAPRHQRGCYPRACFTNRSRRQSPRWR